MNKKINKEDLILTDFDEDFAKSLRENPKRLANFTKFIITEYEKDNDFELFLEGVKAIAGQ
jgi:hypothetical protein